MIKINFIPFLQTGRTVLSLLLLAGFPYMPACSQQQVDSSHTLEKVVVKGYKKKDPFTAIITSQLLGREVLQQINAHSAGDAAKYFSGVLVKDYGGIGGLKTISVRSLGATHTGVVYDGVPVTDVQNGQIDLGRFSTTFVESIELSQADQQHILAPARTYSYAAVLSMQSLTTNQKLLTHSKWMLGIKAGSFNLWQPFAAFYKPAGKKTTLNVNAEATWAKGDYPFMIDNGSFSKKTYRNNADLNSVQAEVGSVTRFSDSSFWQTKVRTYSSARGLPGSIIFFNEKATQRLWNKDIFIQSSYRKKKGNTSWQALAKYSHLYTKYVDPDFLNNARYLDNRYTQQEGYASIGAGHNLGKDLVFSAASDIALTRLQANLQGFVQPTRLSLWNAVSFLITKPRWQLNGSLLYTHVYDKVKTGDATAQKNELSPTIAVGYKPASQSPFLFRAYYKNIFRMPTFNDLYYTFIGNNKLRPEYTKQYNAGIGYSNIFSASVTRVSISADIYYNTIQDKIIAVPTKNLFVWSMLNLGKVRIKGIDLVTETNGNLSSAIKWFSKITYTWQQARDVTDPSSSKYRDLIPYTPVHSGSGLAWLQYKKKWIAGYSALFSGSRYTLGENNSYNQVEGWLTHDLFLSHSIERPSFNLHIRAELCNVLNNGYDVVRYFPMPGRSFKINITLSKL